MATGLSKLKNLRNPANDTVMQCTICNSKGEIHDKEFDEYFDSHPLLKSLQRKLN